METQVERVARARLGVRRAWRAYINAMFAADEAWKRWKRPARAHRAGDVVRIPAWKRWYWRAGLADERYADWEAESRRLAALS